MTNSRPSAEQTVRPATNDDVTVRRLDPSEWTTLQNTRLCAVEDAPEAFLTRMDDLKKLDEWGWRALFHRTRWIVAELGSGTVPEVVGVAASVTTTPTERHLESIWVAPWYRRLRIASQLVNSLVTFERLHLVTDIRLWILEDNTAARRTYESLGFRLTGDRQAVDPSETRYEVRMDLLSPRQRDADSRRTRTERSWLPVR